MKRLASFVPVVLSFSLLALTSACNVPPQKKMPETPSLMRQVELRTTPAGQTGRTNFLLSYGYKNDIEARWSILGYENTNLVLDKPNVMATECDATQIQYRFEWVLTDNTTTAIEAPMSIGPDANRPDVTQSPFPLETSARFDLRVHLTNISTCKKVSFAFEVFEAPGYAPASDPMQVSTDGNVLVNTLQPRAAYITTSTHMYVLPASPQAQTYQVMDPTELPQSTVVAPCQYTPQYTLQMTDAHNVVTTSAVTANPAASDPTAITFATDPTKKVNALIVAIAKGAQCQNQPYSFGVKAVATPNPSPTPTPSPSAPPTAIPTGGIDPASPVPPAAPDVPSAPAKAPVMAPATPPAAS